MLENKVRARGQVYLGRGGSKVAEARLSDDRSTHGRSNSQLRTQTMMQLSFPSLDHILRAPKSKLHLTRLFRQMARYGYQAQLDPRVSVYHDTDMDFSKGSFGRHPRAIAIKQPEEQRRVSHSPSVASSEYQEPPVQPESRDPDPEAAATKDDAPPVVGAYVAWTGGVE